MLCYKSNKTFSTDYIKNLTTVLHHYRFYTMSPSLKRFLIYVGYYLYYVDHFIFRKQVNFILFYFFDRLPFMGRTSASQPKMRSCCS